MGNIQALNTARSISKQLATTRQDLLKLSDRQNEVNSQRKRENSESTGSVDYGVTKCTQLPSVAHGSGYLKVANNGLSAMNDSRKHLGLAKVVDNTNNDWSDHSFVYYGVRKSNAGTQDVKLATRGERTAIDESTESVGNKKHPVVVDLTLDDSDDEDSGVGGGSAGQGVSKNCGSISGAVGGTRSEGGSNSVSDSNQVGVSSVCSGVVVSSSGTRIGVSGGSRVSVSCGGSRVGGSRVGVSGGCSRHSVSSGGNTRSCGSDGDIKVVSSNDSRVNVSRGGRRINDSSEIVVNIGGSGVGINGDDSVVGEDGDDIISQGQPNTLPKILAAYSLYSGHPSSPATGLRNLLSQKAKENVVKLNGMVVNGSADILTKGPNPGMLTASPLKNGIISQPKNDVISKNNQSSFEPIASNRNDVMNDVTNLRNEESSTKKDGHTQMVFSNWNVEHDSNLDTILRDQDGATSPTETGDQVIITKVVTSADKNYGRKQHPRKAPVQIRKLYFEENSEGKVIPSPSSGREGLKRNRKTNSLGTNGIERPEKRNLEETIASLNGNINGTPWSFTMKSDQSYREEKIQNLKARLSKQQEAVEKLRPKEGTAASRSNSVGRVLVVRISDLKDKLGIQSEKKQSFRVFDQKDRLDNVGSGNKRKRKTLDRKGSYRSQKRTRTHIEKEIAKQRPPRCRRGRSNYHVVRKVEQIVPVVSKDLWHREMEKMEEELASSNRALDKNAFLLFLGLKRVEAS